MYRRTYRRTYPKCRKTSFFKNGNIYCRYWIGFVFKSNKKLVYFTLYNFSFSFVVGYLLCQLCNYIINNKNIFEEKHIYLKFLAGFNRWGIKTSLVLKNIFSLLFPLASRGAACRIEEYHLHFRLQFLSKYLEWWSIKRNRFAFK